MLVDYRGRKLEIRDEFIEDYNKFHLPFDQADIDVFVFNMYIHDEKREQDIPSVVETLSDQEIMEAINYALKWVNGFYYQDKNYGA